MNIHEKSKIVAALCYIVVGLVWYLIDENMKHSKLVTFHAKQAINLIIVSILFSIISSIITPLFSILLIIPIFGLIITGMLSLILGIISLGLLVLGILGIINAIQEETKELPIIGKYAKKYLSF